MGLLIGLQQAAIVALTLSCARSARADRTYWPMIVVVFTALAAVYGGSFVSNTLAVVAAFRAEGMWWDIAGGTPDPVIRLTFNAAMLAAVGYARWFIHRRNRTPRYVSLDIAGHAEARSVDELDRATTLAESWAHHGAMPPGRMAALRAALDEGERKQRWLEDARREVDARRARKRGIE